MPQYPHLLLLIVFALCAPQASAGEPSNPDPWEPSNPDPWEPFNRRIFAFNEALDRYALKPVARGYRAVTPDPVERGVTNFINNVYELNTVLNSMLQGRLDNAARGGGRFLLNTTVGIVGLFDVATGVGLERRPADFGQTLAVWGFPSGPFLMVPVLGPRTVSTGVGSVADAYVSLPSQQNEDAFAWGFLAVEAIDVRAELLRADELITGDRYIFIRSTYLQHRKRFNAGGVVDDSFSDFEEGEDFEDF